MLYRSALLAATLAVAANAQGIINNQDEANQIISSAAALSGKYTITNVDTGAKLVYTHDNQPNLFPSTDPLEQLLEKIEAAFSSSSAVAENVFELIPNGGDNSVMIANTQSLKAAAAQWSDDGLDSYAVAYGYGDGGTGTTGDREYWYFVPCGSSSSSSSSSGSNEKWAQDSAVSSSSSSASATSTSSSSQATGVKCDKNPEWLWRHGRTDSSAYIKKHPECAGLAKEPKCSKDGKFLHEHPSYADDHTYCKSTLEEYNSKLGKRAPIGHRAILKEKRAAEKRGSQDGTYCIIAKHHLTDMATRVITGKETSAYADAKSAAMDFWDKTDENQHWQVESAE